MKQKIAPFDHGQDPDERLIPISAVQHAVYCMRQAALIHLEQQWAENRYTAEGQVLHSTVDAGRTRSRRGVRSTHALPVGSRTLRIHGVCDLVEIDYEAGGRAGDPRWVFPVEFKRGKPKPHRADEAQLCAQALCLEEMTGVEVPEGALFYGQTKRRVSVPIDAELRSLTCRVIEELREVFDSDRTPPPTRHTQRCRRCSLRDACQPDLVRRRSAGRWVDEQLDVLLEWRDGA